MENIYHDYWEQELMYQFLAEDKCKKKAYVCSPFSADDKEGMLQNMRTARAYMFYAMKKMNMSARAPHAYLPMLVCDKVMGYHYQLVDAYVKFVLTERKFGPKTDTEGIKKRETAAASFEKVVQDGRKRFSSFSPTSQDQYRSTIGNYILTVLSVWMQYRNTYINV